MIREQLQPCEDRAIIAGVQDPRAKAANQKQHALLGMEILLSA